MQATLDPGPPRGDTEYRGELGPDDAERIAAFLQKGQSHFPITFEFLKSKFEELTQPEPAKQSQDAP